MINKIIKNNINVRITLAFYNFIRNNQNWNNSIENVISNKFKEISDFDFEYNKKLYSLYFEYDNDNNINCVLKEYDKFYDNCKDVKELNFNYNLEDECITNIYE